MTMLRFFFKLTLGLLVTLLLLIGLAAGGLFYKLNKPEFTISERTLSWVSKIFLQPLDINFTFRTLQLQVVRLEDDWFQRSIVIRSEDLQITLPGLLTADIPDLDLHLELNFHPKHYAITTIGPITLTGAKVAVTLPKPDSKNKTEPLDLQLWLQRLRPIHFHPIQLGFKGLVINRPDAPSLLGVLLVNLQRQEDNKWVFAVRADKLKGTQVKQANFEVAVNLPETSELLPLALNLKGRAQLQKLGWAQLAGNGRLVKADKGQFNLELKTSIDQQFQKVRASGALDGENFNLKVNAEATNPIEGLQKVEIESCALEGRVGQPNKLFLDSLLKCKIALTRLPAPQEKPLEEMLPKHFQFTVQGPIRIPVWDESLKFEASLSIALTPLVNEYYQIKGQTEVKMSGKLLELAHNLNAEIDVNTQLVMDRFQTMVHRLARTEFSVPAPFNMLDGRIFCNIAGRIRKTGSAIDLPVECGTELSSETQSLVILAKGSINKDDKQKAQIHLNIGLNKIVLELPKLALNGRIPQIFPDKRIVKISAQKDGQEQPLPVLLDLQITTPPDHPILLVSSLQPKPVPISINLQIKGDNVRPTGRIAVENYRVTFLKKNAQVDHLALVLEADRLQPSLDGLVLFDDLDVRIKLKLSGTLDRPFYELESSPPRNPTELLSIVLFGGEADALDEENLRSVENTRAAMVDGAIGLISMYYLASTPIESVGYNPGTGLFRARMKVAEGLSLSVGSDLGGARQSVSLHKRLTENWSFDTGAETDVETKKNKGTAMFKWGRRY